MDTVNIIRRLKVQQHFMDSNTEKVIHDSECSHD
jgi:hypothetical protein